MSGYRPTVAFTGTMPVPFVETRRAPGNDGSDDDGDDPDASLRVDQNIVSTANRAQKKMADTGRKPATKWKPDFERLRWYIKEAIRRKDWSGAESFCSTALAHDRSNPIWLCLRARVRNMQGKYGAALRDAEACLFTHPSYATAHYRKAQAYLLMGDAQGAMGALGEALSLHTLGRLVGPLPGDSTMEESVERLRSMLERCQDEASVAALAPPGESRKVFSDQDGNSQLMCLVPEIHWAGVDPEELVSEYTRGVAGTNALSKASHARAAMQAAEDARLGCPKCAARITQAAESAYAGPPPTARDDRLRAAIDRADVDTALALLHDPRLDPLAVNLDGLTPLHAAANGVAMDAAMMEEARLVATGKASPRDSEASAHAESVTLAILESLLGLGVPVDLRAPLGGTAGVTPLQTAMVALHPSVVHRLLEHGADPALVQPHARRPAQALRAQHARELRGDDYSAIDKALLRSRIARGQACESVYLKALADAEAAPREASPHRRRRQELGVNRPTSLSRRRLLEAQAQAQRAAEKAATPKWKPCSIGHLSGYGRRASSAGTFGQARGGASRPQTAPSQRKRGVPGGGVASGDKGALRAPTEVTSRSMSIFARDSFVSEAEGAQTTAFGRFALDGLLVSHVEEVAPERPATAMLTTAERADLEKMMREMQHRGGVASWREISHERLGADAHSNTAAGVGAAGAQDGKSGTSAAVDSVLNGIVDAAAGGPGPEGKRAVANALALSMMSLPAGPRESVREESGHGQAEHMRSKRVSIALSCATEAHMERGYVTNAVTDSVAPEQLGVRQDYQDRVARSLNIFKGVPGMLGGVASLPRCLRAVMAAAQQGRYPYSATTPSCACCGREWGRNDHERKAAGGARRPDSAWVRCSACRLACYCCERHRVEDWPRHEDRCRLIKAQQVALDTIARPNATVEELSRAKIALLSDSYVAVCIGTVETCVQAIDALATDHTVLKADLREFDLEAKRRQEAERQRRRSSYGGLIGAQYGFKTAFFRGELGLDENEVARQQAIEVHRSSLKSRMFHILDLLSSLMRPPAGFRSAEPEAEDDDPGHEADVASMLRDSSGGYAAGGRAVRRVSIPAAMEPRRCPLLWEPRHALADAQTATPGAVAGQASVRFFGSSAPESLIQGSLLALLEPTIGDGDLLAMSSQFLSDHLFPAFDAPVPDAGATETFYRHLVYPCASELMELRRRLFTRGCPGLTDLLAPLAINMLDSREEEKIPPFVAPQSALMLALFARVSPGDASRVLSALALGQNDDVCAPLVKCLRSAYMAAMMLQRMHPTAARRAGGDHSCVVPHAGLAGAQELEAVTELCLAIFGHSGVRMMHEDSRAYRSMIRYAAALLWDDWEEQLGLMRFTRGTRLALVNQLTQHSEVFWNEVAATRLGVPGRDQRTEILSTSPFAMFGSGVLSMGAPAMLLSMAKAAIWAVEHDRPTVTTRMGAQMHHLTAARLLRRIFEFTPPDIQKILTRALESDMRGLLAPRTGIEINASAVDPVAQAAAKEVRQVLQQALGHLMRGTHELHTAGWVAAVAAAAPELGLVQKIARRKAVDMQQAKGSAEAGAGGA
ncbi:unnamed protein product [Pedinophyceae sp. YPF-701]|nr:unnamed protein product [Pedinophyceae sp. YPF-701]